MPLTSIRVETVGVPGRLWGSPKDSLYPLVDVAPQFDDTIWVWESSQAVIQHPVQFVDNNQLVRIATGQCAGPVANAHPIRRSIGRYGSQGLAVAEVSGEPPTASTRPRVL
jgi:hypothetical protein